MLIDLPQPLIHIHTHIHVCTHMHVCSCGRLFVTPWTIVHQAPLSMEFSRILQWVAISFSNTYAYTHTYVYICTHMCICLQACNHVYTHKYICVYVCVFTYTFISIYIHTYIFILTSSSKLLFFTKKLYSTSAFLEKKKKGNKSEILFRKVHTGNFYTHTPTHPHPPTLIFWPL